MARRARWRIRWTLLIGIAAWVLTCIPTLQSSQGSSQGTGTIAGQAGEVRTFVRTGRLPRRLSEMTMPVPPDNPLTEAKTALGRRLFFEKRLSADGSVSCGTCHDPERGFADNRALAVGIHGRVGKRHSPTLINRGFGRVHFWDGRAATLESQVLQPIADSNEMDLPVEEAIKRLDADESYRTDFLSVFERPVSADDLGRALASYVRSIRSGDSPYDRFVGGDTGALTPEQQHGLQVFGRSGCGVCHREPLFTDERFWNTGVAWNPETGYSDAGRYDVSRNERERGSFKTPTLREVARTAPYMHNGSLATLADVVEFYDKGGRPNRNMLFRVRPLNLSAEDKQALIRFLESLNGTVTGK